MRGRRVIGTLFSNVWVFTGDQRASLFTSPPFVSCNLHRGWYRVRSPLITVNWKADDGDDPWMVPLGGGSGRVFRLGRQPMNSFGGGAPSAEGVMTRFKRLLWIGTALVVILLVGLALFFYRPTRLALERAQVFQFRRMLVTRLGEQNQYRFFYATNRRLECQNGPLAECFGNQREETLKFGFFDTMIEPTLGIGMIINPTDWFQNREIKLQQVQSLGRDEFISQIRQQVEASPLRSLLVNVNGFREGFPSALRKTAFLSHVLDIDTPVLVFDWPGNQGSTPQGYRRAQGFATESGAELASILALVIQRVEPGRLWLVANSMGAQVVVHAFHILYGDAGLADGGTEIEKVVLTAPDVD